MDLFQEARDSFLAQLNSKEKLLVDSATDPDSLLEEVKGLEQKHRDESATRKLIQQISPFLRGIEQYGKAFDVITNVKPEVLSLLWGGARILLHLATEYFELFERIVEMLSRIGKQLGMFEIYAKLYPSSQRLKQRLIEAYVSFLDCCHQVKLLLYEAKPKNALVFKSSSMRIILKSIWKPMKHSFVKVISNMEEAAEDVRREADIAEKQEASEARKKADIQARYERHKAVFDWLDPVDADANHRKARSLHEPSTGAWITNSLQFQSWMKSPGSPLWLYAKAGAGKTILSSTVITYLQQQFQSSDTPIVYHYCDYKNIRSQQPQNILRTILANLCQLSDKVLEFIEEFSENYRKYKTSCSLNSLLQALVECSKRVERVFVVIDALDESIDRHELLEKLAMTAVSQTNINFFLTSRKEFDIERCFEILPQISINSPDVASDIELYVSNQLQSLVKSRKLKLRDPNLQSEIQNTLTTSADGMFQWVKCQLESLCQAISDKAIRTSLKNLPIGLDNTYIRVFERLEQEFPQEINTIKRLFYWLAHSVRIMTAIEISEALYFSVMDGKLDLSSVPTDPLDLLKYGGGLLTLTDNPILTMSTDGTVLRDKNYGIGLAHFSVKEFLLSDRIRRSTVKDFYADIALAHCDIVDTSLTYLSMDDFQCGQTRTLKHYKARMESNQFLLYAARYWMDHYKHLDGVDTDDLDQRVFQFFTDAQLKENVLAWQQIKERERRSFGEGYHWDVFGRYTERKINIVHSLNPMYHAAYYGIWQLTKSLADAGYDVNEYGGHYEYPILAAAFGGISTWDFVSRFIKLGADMHLSSEMGSAAFANAKLGGPQDWWFLKELINAGADINIIGYSSGEKSTILSNIARHPTKPVEMVGFLLSRGASIDIADDNAEYKYRRLTYPALIDASIKSNNLGILQALLDAGADINFVFGFLGSPLQAAIRFGQIEVAYFLIGRGANVNIKGGTLGTPLQAAAWLGHMPLFQVLIDKGADKDAEGGGFGCALAAAIAKNNNDIVEALLHRNADVNRSNGGYYKIDNVRSGFDNTLDFDELVSRQPAVKRPLSTPLNWAIYHGDLLLVERLIDLGAELNLPLGQCLLRNSISRVDHPLCVAVVAENAEMLDLLLRKGAELSIGGYCVFITSACIGRFDIFTQLKRRILTGPELSKIYLEAISCCHQDIEQNLINAMSENEFEFDKDLASKALAGAIQRGFEARVQLLLSLGADPDFSVAYWNTEIGLDFDEPVLLHAIGRGDSTIVEMLLCHHANVNVGSPGQGTPLSMAVRRSDVGLTRKLLAHGASITQEIPGFIRPRYYSCGNLLHLAVQSGDSQIVQILLEEGANVLAHCDFCPTALSCSIAAENLDLMRMLVKSGGDVNERDIYGRTLLQRVRDLHLDEVVTELQALGADFNPPEDQNESYIEHSVHSLSEKLNKSSASLHPGEINRKRWLILGRCLFLGNDVDNAIIALEQSTLCYSWEATCQLCDRGKREITDAFMGSGPRVRETNVMYHLCKSEGGKGICENDCVKKHWQYLKDSGTFENHDYLRYPRQWLSEVPEGQVALSKDEYMPTDDWLGTLKGWKYKKSKGSNVLSQSELGAWYE